MGKRAIAVGLFVAIVIVTSIVYFGPCYQDDHTFTAAERVAATNPDYKVVLRTYEEYLRRFPSGRHADAARARVLETREALARAEFEKAVAEILGNEAYEEARAELHNTLAKEPNNRYVLLQLGLLEWGLDRFNKQAWERSNGYLDKVLALDPDNAVANRLKQHNAEFEPGTIPTADKQGLSGTSEITVDTYWRPSFAFFALLPGETMRFFPDGRFRSITDAQGNNVWRADSDPELGEVMIYKQGEKHLWLARDCSWGSHCPALTKIAKARKTALDIESN